MENVDDSYFDWSDDDDIICSSKYISSDEEDDTFFNFPTSRTSKKASVFGSKKNEEEEDDFEKEMASELSQTVRHLAASFSKGPQSSSRPGGTSTPAVGAPQGASKEAPEFYDDVYFDSDESDNEETTSHTPGSKKKAKQNRRVMSNDDLFYDPTMDDKDQAWVDRKRRSYQLKRKGAGLPGAARKDNKLPQSDAVLNCPACLTTLCMDCQRHEIYHNQYRAMFVFNCRVDVTERLKYPSKDQKKRNFIKNKKMKKIKQRMERENKDNHQSPAASLESVETEGVGSSQQHAGAEGAALGGEPAGSFSPPATGRGATSEASSLPTGLSPTDRTDDDDDVFHPVTCKICNTKVAVYDTDEVYHFFNVVTSY